MSHNLAKHIKCFHMELDPNEKDQSVIKFKLKAGPSSQGSNASIKAKDIKAELQAGSGAAGGVCEKVVTHAGRGGTGDLGSEQEESRESSIYRTKHAKVKDNDGEQTREV